MNAEQKRKRSQVGVELVRLLTSEGERIFSIARARDLAARIDLKDSYLWEALYHLRQNGWIVSLRRGLYAISPTVPGATPAHEFEIAMSLVDPAAISHWSALHYHGLTEQIPRRIFVLTTTGTSIPRERGTRGKQVADGYSVGNLVYRFIQVKPERFFGIKEFWAGDARVKITDPERTLLDGLSMPQYFGDFAEVLHAFEAIGDNLNIVRIIEYASKLDVAITKRLGWVLEYLGYDSERLKHLEEIPVKGYRKLDPTGPGKGSCNRRWMIQENLPGKVML